MGDGGAFPRVVNGEYQLAARAFIPISTFNGC